MGNILDDLTGGRFSLKKQPAMEKTTYDVFIQFDTDGPKQLYNNVPIGPPFVLQIDGPSEDASITFTDMETGKKFKIFLK